MFHAESYNLLGTTPIGPGRSVRPRSCDICRRPQTGSAGAGGMIRIGCSAPRGRGSCWRGPADRLRPPARL